MLISDWSSDVCSSDLLPFSRACNRPRGPVSLFLTTFICEIVSVHNNKNERSQSGCLGASFVRVSRSEEHTSELQSLMRISYAVFCLKKKKKNNDQRQNRINTQYTTKEPSDKHTCKTTDTNSKK